MCRIRASGSRAVTVSGYRVVHCVTTLVEAAHWITTLVDGQTSVDTTLVETGIGLSAFGDRGFRGVLRRATVVTTLVARASAVWTTKVVNRLQLKVLRPVVGPR